jgi:hypothetical protein
MQPRVRATPSDNVDGLGVMSCFVNFRPARHTI